MNTKQFAKLDGQMGEFLCELLALMGRSERRKWASIYIQGLLLDGDRKSIDPIASSIPGADVQALRQFVNQSPWEEQPIQQALALKLVDQLHPKVWIIDETCFPKAGYHSVGVDRQYCSALGKVANCQVAVSLHLSQEQFSCPIFWSLYLPKRWREDPERLKEVKVPESIVYESKQDQAMTLLAAAKEAGLPLLPVLADSFYGNTARFRSQLREWNWPYAVAVEPTTVAWDKEPDLSVEEQSGPGRPRVSPPLEEMRPAKTLEALALNLPRSAYRKVTWKEGVKGKMSSRFASIPVWAARGWRKSLHPKREEEILLIEWPLESEKPTKYFMLWLGGEKKSLREMVRLAHARWRVAMDYRELKEELGLDHYEGRHWDGFHHHVTLVSMAYGFLQWHRATKIGRWSKRRPANAAAARKANASPPRSNHRKMPLVPVHL